MSYRKRCKLCGKLIAINNKVNEVNILDTHYRVKCTGAKKFRKDDNKKNDHSE